MNPLKIILVLSAFITGTVLLSPGVGARDLWTVEEAATCYQGSGASGG